MSLTRTCINIRIYKLQVIFWEASDIEDVWREDLTVEATKFATTVDDPVVKALILSFPTMALADIYGNLGYPECVEFWSGFLTKDWSKFSPSM